MIRFLAFLLAVLALPVFVRAETAGEPEEPVHFVADAETDSIGTMIHSFDTPTLKFTLERFVMTSEKCYLIRIWVRNPAEQIRKKTAQWEKGLSFARDMAKKLPEALLVVNGSGFVSPQYPEIPENYPGTSEDYFYTPLGSLTVTDGEVYRNLEGVPYIGLALTADGLQMYTGAENDTVLAEEPVQTWAFYPSCPMLRNNEDLLPEEWPFADKRAARTVIARLDAHNYLILTATAQNHGGITLRRASEFFTDNFSAEWVFNLDGGPSTSLLYRKKAGGRLSSLAGGVKIEDIMGFTE